MEPIKNAKANEFLAQADALVKEIADPAVKLTPDEVKQKMDGVEALRQRARAVADLTPERVAEKELGLVKLDVSNGDPVETTKQEASEIVMKVFGSRSRYLLALARRTDPEAKPWTEKQIKAHRTLQDLHKRAIVGAANDASGGEFLLPLTQAPDIFVGAQIIQPGLWERAPRYPCPGRTVRIPYLVQDDVNPHTRPLSGISAVSIESEGGEKDEKQPSFAQRTVTAFKYAAYTEWGDETLEDDYTGEGSDVIIRAVGGDLINSVNADVTISGAGTTAPLGALHTNNGALITVNRQTSQTIVAADVFNMLSRGTMGPGSFFAAHTSTIPQLYSLALSSGSQVTFLSNLRDGAVGQLCGRPLVITPLLSVLGVAGDFALIDPAQYATVARRELTVESSIHYKFRNDLTAYRFHGRFGGAPIPSSEYSFASSGTTATWAFSGFVRLGDDITS